MSKRHGRVGTERSSSNVRLSRVTADGWTVRVVTPDWPEERVVLEPPGDDVLSERHSEECVQIDTPTTELRAAGFSPDGSRLIVATSSDVRFWFR